jgi:hypothetical protein
MSIIGFVSFVPRQLLLITYMNSVCLLPLEISLPQGLRSMPVERRSDLGG